MTEKSYEGIISRELSVNEAFVKNTIILLQNGATIPFIARYRKEMTGSMDEVMITRVRDRLSQLKELDARRDTILKSIKEQEKLTEELEKAIYYIERNANAKMLFHALTLKLRAIVLEKTIFLTQ